MAMCVGLRAKSYLTDMTIVKIKKQWAQKSVIKWKLKFENDKNCLDVIIKINEIKINKN